MKHVKLFEAFSTISLTEEQISWLDECARGSWSLNPLTGLVDVDGDFKCISQRLKDFKGVAFGHVKGNFNCGGNLLTDLKGAPETVDVGFSCRSNQLTSLEGAPQTVGVSFDCGSNRLTSLVGAPKIVNGYFVCDKNQLTSLEGAPKTVNGIFYCEYNPVSEETLASIFKIMKKGKSYQQALEESWPKMDNEDRALMYKDHRSLTSEESRRYQALGAVNRIKKYL